MKLTLFDYQPIISTEPQKHNFKVLSLYSWTQWWEWVVPHASFSSSVGFETNLEQASVNVCWSYFYFFSPLSSSFSLFLPCLIYCLLCVHSFTSALFLNALLHLNTVFSDMFRNMYLKSEFWNKTFQLKFIWIWLTKSWGPFENIFRRTKLGEMLIGI